MASKELILIRKEPKHQGAIKQLRTLYKAMQNAKRATIDFESRKRETFSMVDKILKDNKATSIICDVTEPCANLQLERKQRQILKVAYVKQASIAWDNEKLAKVLNKQQRQEVFNHTITIKNWNDFVLLMKKHSVDPSALKGLLKIDTIVNEQALNQLSCEGEIIAQQLEGCYNAKVDSVFLQLSESK